MRRSDDIFNLFRKFCRRAPIVAAAVTAAGFAGATGALAASSSAVHLLMTAPLPAALTAGLGVYSYDISWIDQTTQLFHLADRSDKAIDIVDAATGKWKVSYTATPSFAGVGSSTENSGPNGVVTTTSGCIVATDAGARVVSFTSGGTQVTDLHLNTMPGRADELSFDPADNLLAIENPFPGVTTNTPRPNLYLVKISTGCTLTVVKKIPLPFATNGLEQSVWDPATKLFYVSVPQVGDASISTGLHGLVIAVDPHTGKITKAFPINMCQPAGLALNPTTGDLLAGCSTVFDTKGMAWNGFDTNYALPIQVVVDPTTGVTTDVPGVGASDEVAYNGKDGDWYTGSSGSPYAPMSVNPASPANLSQGAEILGVIDGTTDALLQLAPTFTVPATATHPSGSGHSVAANDSNGWVFVPSPANHAIRGCGFGCIQIFSR
jgi:hypothetical protein